MNFLLSAYWLMVLLALLFVVLHIVRADPGKPPLSLAVLFAIVALMVSGVPK